MKPKTSRRSPWLARNLICLAIGMGVATTLYVEFLIERYTGYFLTITEAKVVDLRFRLRGPIEPSGEVVIVAIDGKSTEELGRWPWSRTTHAGLIDSLREWGARTIVFDVLFVEEEGQREAAHLREIERTLPEPESTDSSDAFSATRATVSRVLEEAEVDTIFAEALERTYADDAALSVLAFDFVFAEDLGQSRHLGSVLDPGDEQIILDMASYISRDENTPVLRRQPPKLALGIRPVITGLAEWSAALGYANPVFDKDGALRREQVTVVYSPAVREAFQSGARMSEALLNPDARVQAYMPLAVAGVATHLRLGVDQVVLDLPSGELRLDAPEDRGGELVHHFSSEDGTAWIDFYGPTETFTTYSFVDVLKKRLTGPDGRPISGPEAFADKLVLVGTTDHGLGDFFVTPFTARLPGVEKHANLIENVLTGRQARTPRDVQLTVGISALVAAVVVALIAGNLGTLLATAILGGLTASWLGLTYADFVNNGLLWNWTVPILSIVLSYAGVVGYRSASERRAKRAMEERSRFIQSTFGRYLSDQVVERLVDSPDALRLGGERRRITIMMSDLRGFSSLCEQSTPDVVIGLLNHYLGAMTEIIFKHGGTIDEFIGDAILALFGAPESHGDDAARAVACAIEMQLAMPSVNQHLRAKNFPEVEMGIALNTGEVIVGNIGSERRAKYGIVGSNVNLTGRIESLTVGGQIFISGQTLEEVQDVVEVGASTAVRAKGFSDPIPVHEIRAMGPPYDLRLPVAKEQLITLDEPVAVEFSIIEEKEVTTFTWKARLVRLSSSGADLECESRLEPLVNLKIKVFRPDGGEFDQEIYAKVVDREATPGCAAITFTSNPTGVKQYLTSLLEA